MRACINYWAKSFIMIVNMSKYDKIIHITNMDDYKKVCDKLDKMWYIWASKNKLSDYVYLDDIVWRTMYSDYKIVRRQKSEYKLRWYWNSITAKKFLSNYSYDL